MDFEMTTFVDTLGLMLNGLEKMIEPPADMKPDDRKVGILEDEDVKKLYSLAMQCDRQAEELVIQIRYSGADERSSMQMLAKIKELKTKAELIREIFWASIKDSFGLWDKDSIGVRRGWVVVWNEPDSNIRRLIDFFGG